MVTPFSAANRQSSDVQEKAMGCDSAKKETKSGSDRGGGEVTWFLSLPVACHVLLAVIVTLAAIVIWSYFTEGE